MFSPPGQGLGSHYSIFSPPGSGPGPGGPGRTGPCARTRARCQTSAWYRDPSTGAHYSIFSPPGSGPGARPVLGIRTRARGPLLHFQPTGIRARSRGPGRTRARCWNPGPVPDQCLVPGPGPGAHYSIFSPPGSGPGSSSLTKTSSNLTK